MASLSGQVRQRLAAAAAEPFSHGAPPLAHTHDHAGDPGLFGPSSTTWRVMGRTATFIGGIRALLVQAAHPEVVAGVADHSRYRDDPLGRLTRTANFVTVTAFGAMPEVEAAVDEVRRRHRPVAGTSHRGMAYRADRPELAAWVHNALTESFLVAHQAYSVAPLSPAEADEFVREQRRLGALLGADPMPGTATALSRWVAEHPAVAPSPGMADAVGFLRSPPLTRGQQAGYRLIFAAAVATLPPRLREVLGVSAPPGALASGRATGRLLQWALGDSPAWQAALQRVGARLDVGDFRRPLRGAPD